MASPRRFARWPGRALSRGYLESLNITWADTPQGRGPTGTAIRTGKPAFCRNMLTDPLFEPWRKEAIKRGYASSLVLPLLDAGQAFGALTVYFAEPDPFTPQEVSLMKELADDLAHGITAIRDRAARAEAEEAMRQLNSQLEQRVAARTGDLVRTVESLHAEVTERLVVEQELRRRTEQLQGLATELTLAEQRERVRLARVLHDGLQQLLVAAQFRLAMLARSKDESVQRSTEQVGQLLMEAIETSRSLTVELSPPVLRDGGFTAGLEWLCRWMKDKHALEVRTQIDQSVAHPMPEAMKVLLFQSVRELLFNVVKHAGARSAKLAANRDDGSLRIVVSDNGAGFEQRTAGGAAGGFGLFSIGERLAMLGGRLDIKSQPGSGTTVTMSVPLATEAELPMPSTPKAIATAKGQGQVDGLAKIRVVLVDDPCGAAAGSGKPAATGAGCAGCRRGRRRADGRGNGQASPAGRGADGRVDARDERG